MSNVYYFPHPFTHERQELNVPDGTPIDTLLDKNISIELTYHIFLNGILIPKENYGYKIQKDDEVIIRLIPTSSDTNTNRETATSTKAIGSVVLGALAIVAGVIIPGAQWLIAVGFATALGGQIVAGLTDAGIIGGPYSDELGTTTHPSIHGASNSSNPNGKVPLPLGTHLYTPGYLAPPYSYISGTDGIDEYAIMAFVLGIAPVKVSNIKMGDNLIATNSANVKNGAIAVDGIVPGVEIEIRQDGTALSLYPYCMGESSFSEGLTGFKNVSLSGHTVQISASGRYAYCSDITWNNLTDTDNDHADISIAVGDSVGFSGFTNAANNRQKIVTAVDEHYIYFQQDGNLVNESSSSLQLIGYKSAVHTTGKHTRQIIVTITFPKLVRYSGSSKNNASVLVKAFYRQKTLDGATPANWTEFQNDFGTISNNKAETLRYSASTVNTLTDINDTILGQYEVMVVRATKDAQDSNIVDLVYWTECRSVTTIETMPEMYRDKIAIMAIKVKASTATQNVMNKVNMLLSADYSYLDSVDSRFTAIREANSSNPALAFLHVLMSNGVPRPRVASQIDLDSVYNFAAFCNEPNSANTDYVMKCDGIITDGGKASSQLYNILNVGFGMLTFKDSLYGIVYDHPQTTIKQHIGPHNSSGFTEHKTFKEVIHGYRIKFVNENLDYVSDERIVLDDGYKYDTEMDGVLRDCWGTDRTSDTNYTIATKFETLEALYQVTPEAVFCWGRRLLAIRRLRPESFDVSMSAECIAVGLGELVRFQSFATRQGLADGRIVLVERNSSDQVVGIQCNNKITLDSSKSYAIRIRTSDGQSVYTLINNTMRGLYPSDNLVPSDSLKPFDAMMLEITTPFVNDAIAEGDLMFIGEVGMETIEGLVYGMNINSDLSGKLTLVESAQDIFTADSGTIPAFNSKVTKGPSISRPTGVSVTLTAASNAQNSAAKAQATADTKNTCWGSLALAQANAIINDTFIDSANAIGYGTTIHYRCTVALAASYVRIDSISYGSLTTAPTSGMIANDTYYNSTTTIWYYYSGSAWVASSVAIASVVASYAPTYLGKYHNAHPSSYNNGDFWLVYSTDTEYATSGLRGVYYSNSGTATLITTSSSATLLGKMVLALADIAWAEKNSYGDASDYGGFDAFFTALGAVTAFIQNLYAQNVTLPTSGYLKSYNYAEDASEFPTAGFKLDVANQIIKSFGAQFVEAIIKNAYFSGSIESDPLSTTLPISISSKAWTTSNTKGDVFSFFSGLAINRRYAFDSTFTYNGSTIVYITRYRYQVRLQDSSFNAILVCGKDSIDNLLYSFTSSAITYESLVTYTNFDHPPIESKGTGTNSNITLTDPGIGNIGAKAFVVTTANTNYTITLPSGGIWFYIIMWNSTYYAAINSAVASAKATVKAGGTTIATINKGGSGNLSGMVLYWEDTSA